MKKIYKISSEELIEAIKDFLKKKKIKTKSFQIEYPSCCKHSMTFYETVVNSPQWKAWEQHCQKEKGKCKYDTVESVELGKISRDHFQEFLNWCNSTILKFNQK